jgi:hypothetical protein
MARNPAPADKPRGESNGNGRKPSHIIRARQSPDSDFHITVGAVWPFREGEGYVIKLQALPVNWNGDLLMVVPKDGE